MTKTLTPMTRLSNPIKNFTNSIEKLFKHTNLNKSQPASRRYPYPDKKGIENDYILLFESLQDPTTTFGICFTYIDLEEKEQKAKIILKKYIGEEAFYYSTEDISIEMFKLCMREVNNFFNNTPHPLEQDVWDILTLAFSIDPEFIREKIINTRLSYEQSVKDKENELHIPDLEKTIQQLTSQYNKANKNANAEIIASIEYKNFKILEAQLAQAKKQLNDKEAEINSHYHIPTLKTEINSTTKKLEKNNKLLDEFKKSHFKKISKNKKFDY